MKYGIEFEYFVSKGTTIIPAYKATSNLDGNPFLGEIRTAPNDSLIETLFELDKKIFLEKQALLKLGYCMEIIPRYKFLKADLLEFRKDKSALNKKELEVLEEFSVYPNGETGKILEAGEVAASLQLNLSENKIFQYDEFVKVQVEKSYKYDKIVKEKSYSILFNYVDIIRKLDLVFEKDITETNRVKGVYAIKDGVYGSRIEYRSLPNTVDYKKMFEV